jgi:hypothetical protein
MPRAVSLRLTETTTALKEKDSGDAARSVSPTGFHGSRKIKIRRADCGSAERNVETTMPRSLVLTQRGGSCPRTPPRTAGRQPTQPTPPRTVRAAGTPRGCSANCARDGSRLRARAGARSRPPARGWLSLSTQVPCGTRSALARPTVPASATADRPAGKCPGRSAR